MARAMMSSRSSGSSRVSSSSLTSSERPCRNASTSARPSQLLSVASIQKSIAYSETESLPWRRRMSSLPASKAVEDRSNTRWSSAINRSDVRMHGRSMVHATVPHFLAFPVSCVMTYATRAASVGNVHGWSWKMSWHWARNSLHSPGALSYLSGTGSRGSHTPGSWGRPLVPPEPAGVAGAEDQSAEVGWADWTAVDSMAIWWEMVWTHCMMASSCCPS